MLSAAGGANRVACLPPVRCGVHLRQSKAWRKKIKKAEKAKRKFEERAKRKGADERRQVHELLDRRDKERRDTSAAGGA